MEGVFSFFLESAFLGLFLYGEKRISKLMHWFSAVNGLPGIVDLRFFHHRHRRMDAAPGGYDRLPTGNSKSSASGNCC